jgi:hypothetical protein
MSKIAAAARDSVRSSAFVTGTDEHVFFDKVTRSEGAVAGHPYFRARVRCAKPA